MEHQAQAAARIGTVAAPRRISVLGATGSIGVSTLDLIARDPRRYRIVALTANGNVTYLAELARHHRAEIAVVADEARYLDLKEALSGSGIEAAAGPDALVAAAARPADWIMAAISGAAGLRPTFEAVRQGATVALANKECLVSAGEVFMRAVSEAGAVLLPVDSEHSAAFQAIGPAAAGGIERIVLTASGGPFRTWSAERMARATPEDALRHPTWEMGPKITVDCATMMNKGLELIEAFHLFPVRADQLETVVHPQSIIHCFVHYHDGSVLAQMSSPDMRTPIAYSLSWPHRMAAPTERLDLIKLRELTFEAPDEGRFPALRLAREVLQSEAGASTLFNAANEVAVDAFLDRRIGFLSIARLVEKALEAAAGSGIWGGAGTLDEVLAADAEGRALARSLLRQAA